MLIKVRFQIMFFLQLQHNVHKELHGVTCSATYLSNKIIFPCSYYIWSYKCSVQRGGGGETTGWGGDFDCPCMPYVGTFIKFWTEMLAPGSKSLNDVKTKESDLEECFWMRQMDVEPGYEFSAIVKSEESGHVSGRLRWRNELQDNLLKFVLMKDHQFFLLNVWRNMFPLPEFAKCF